MGRAAKRFYKQSALLHSLWKPRESLGHWSLLWVDTSCKQRPASCQVVCFYTMTAQCTESYNIQKKLGSKGKHANRELSGGNLSELRFYQHEKWLPGLSHLSKAQNNELKKVQIWDRSWDEVKQAEGNLGSTSSMIKLLSDSVGILVAAETAERKLEMRWVLRCLYGLARYLMLHSLKDLTGLKETSLVINSVKMEPTLANQ